MAIQYTVRCRCGKPYPVETRQSGGEIVCECGETIAIPSMLQLRKLPIWEGAPDSGSAEKSDPTGQDGYSSPQTDSVVQAESEKPGATNDNGQITPASGNTFAKSDLPPVLAGNRLGVFIIGCLLSLFFGYAIYRLTTFPPNPLAVFFKQTAFANDGNVVRRNSSPVSESDYEFFLFYDPHFRQTFVVDDHFIDQAMGPFLAYKYLDSLKNGLQLSDNFYENFEEVKNNWRVRLGASILALVISLIICAIPWLMPRKKKVVGAIRGAQWKA